MIRQFLSILISKIQHKFKLKAAKMLVERASIVIKFLYKAPGEIFNCLSQQVSAWICAKKEMFIFLGGQKLYIVFLTCSDTHTQKKKKRKRKITRFYPKGKWTRTQGFSVDPICSLVFLYEKKRGNIAVSQACTTRENTPSYRKRKKNEQLKNDRWDPYKLLVICIEGVNRGNWYPPVDSSSLVSNTPRNGTYTPPTAAGYRFVN